MSRLVSATLSALIVLCPATVSSAARDVARVDGVACPVGAPPTIEAPDNIVQPDGSRPLTPPVVLGCGQARHYGPYQAIGYRIGPTLNRSQLCTIADHASTSGGICNRPSGGAEVNAVTFRINHGGKPGWWEVVGRTTRRVATLTARYRSHGRVVRRRVSLIQVSDATLLAKLIVKKAFGFYDVEVAPNARRLFMIARDSHGEVIESHHVRQLH
jgi:hypothetical protein